MAHEPRMSGQGQEVEMAMNRCPKIGDRVRYTPPKDCHRVGECTGTVRAIYKEHEWDAERECEGPLLPERDWSVGVEVDEPLPSWWAYAGTNRFAPTVRELTRLPS